MKARLISRTHGEFPFDATATIGRAAGSTVQLEASVVSNEHAKIRFEEARSAYVLEDLGSLNGTFLDGVRIDREEVLGSLHVIRFGDEEDFVFHALSVEPASVSTPEPEGETVGIPATGKTQVGGEIPVLPTSLREPAAGDDDTSGTRVEKGAVPVPEVLAQASDRVLQRKTVRALFALEISLGEETKTFPLVPGSSVVGRSKAADIRLELPDLSRRHATVIVSEKAVRVRDEGSRNRTFVNGEAIDGEIVVEVGAEIVFGRLEAKLVALEPEADTEVAIPGDDTE